MRGKKAKALRREVRHFHSEHNMPLADKPIYQHKVFTRQWVDQQLEPLTGKVVEVLKEYKVYTRTLQHGCERFHNQLIKKLERQYNASK